MVLNTTDLEESIINHEGLMHHAYTDTVGNVTIGIGRNCSATGPGISTDEAVYLLRNDITKCKSDLSNFFWFKSQDIVRQEVLIELRFSMGLDGLLQFALPGGMISLMQQHNYEEAADHLLNSKWAKDVHEDRADNLANRLRTGTY